MKKPLGLLIAVLAVAGCATIQDTPPDTDQGRAIRSLAPAADKGVLYLYRDRMSHYGLFAIDIGIGGQDVTTQPACFVRIELPPGRYHLEASHPDLFGHEDELEFDARAGEVSFFEYKPTAAALFQGSTRIIPRSRDEVQSLIHSQNLCASPTVTVPAS